MNVVVVGLGVQGHKRRAVAGADCIATVDPLNKDADHRDLAELDPASYDAAFLCTPDGVKIDLIRRLLDAGKHVLVEKPLVSMEDGDLADLKARSDRSGAVCYTAYNHRFEPHFAAARDVLASGELGRVYSCRMFYGNGTAQLVRDSRWRDQGAGVLPDLGSHLLDTVRFWFADSGVGDRVRVTMARRHENRAFDHVMLAEDGPIALQLEMTLLSWRNHFTADLFCENGSLHIASLCKWGPSSLIVRKRIRPSGRPTEEETVLVKPDPTWALEYDHFKRLAAAGGPSNLDADIWLDGTLKRLAVEAGA